MFKNMYKSQIVGWEAKQKISKSYLARCHRSLWFEKLYFFLISFVAKLKEITQSVWDYVQIREIWRWDEEKKPIQYLILNQPRLPM